jgi:Spy/CpxP family protein refolding chaperone
MKKVIYRWRNVAGVVLLTMLVVVSLASAAAQRPTGPPQPPDVLAGLKHALEEAGAPALTAAQEDQLKDLLTAFRQAQRQQEPSETLQAAHRAYDAAILAGNLAAAQAQAAIIANAQAAAGNTRLQAKAKLQIDVLNVLKTNANQVALLQQRFGSAGLTRLLAAVAGGGPRRGPGGPGGLGRPGGPGGPGGPGRPGGPDGPPPGRPPSDF